MIGYYLALVENESQKDKFEKLYYKYKGMMYKVAFDVTKSRDLAEDVVHEAFLQIIDELDNIRIDNPKELKAYLCIITRNRAIDFLRKWDKKNFDIYSIDDAVIEQRAPKPDEIVLTSIKLEQVLKAIKDMPIEYQIPLVLRYKGYSIREIASIVNCKEATVKTRIHRARQMLLKATET